MPSTYSPILRTELLATGEQAGTWGTAVNTITGTILEALSQVHPQSYSQQVPQTIH